MSLVIARRAVHAALLCTGFVLLRPAALSAQAAASDWSTPTSTQQTGGMFFGMGYMRETFPGPRQLLAANGLAATAGWGHDAPWMRGLSVGYGVTRRQTFDGARPGQLVSTWQADGLLAPRMARLGSRSDVRLTFSGGLRSFEPSASVGSAASPSTLHWQAGAGTSLRLGTPGPLRVTVDLRRQWSTLSDPAFARLNAPERGVRSWWQFRVGMMLHARPRNATPTDLRRFPAGDGAMEPTIPVLRPETGALAGHVDGGAPLGSAGRANARYLGPQTLTVYFKEGRTEFADGSDYDKVVRMAKFLGDVPGTVIVMRSWETPSANPVTVRQMAEQRADRLRDIILAGAPFAAPQRVTSILMGGDFARAENARTRRIDLEYFRP